MRVIILYGYITLKYTYFHFIQPEHIGKFNPKDFFRMFQVSKVYEHEHSHPFQ